MCSANISIALGNYCFHGKHGKHERLAYRVFVECSWDQYLKRKGRKQNWVYDKVDIGYMIKLNCDSGPVTFLTYSTMNSVDRLSL